MNVNHCDRCGEAPRFPSLWPEIFILPVCPSCESKIEHLFKHFLKYRSKHEGELSMSIPPPSSRDGIRFKCVYCGHNGRPAFRTFVLCSPCHAEFRRVATRWDKQLMIPANARPKTRKRTPEAKK